ncbi:hypothetical protein [Beijerinckia sp. L45]|uniref:beta strand repeat-containing protein n=1 Tax=Beijerinckia sp. L45 TaxID=1641855 RepID=UPI00131B0A35|nr:hypothetical protein [Beijerinckia sp. L45]
MALDSILNALSTLRNSEILNGGDALLGDPTSATLQSDDVAASPLAGSSLGSLTDLPNTTDDGNTSGAGLTDAANTAVLDLHSNIEQTADTNGLIGSLHGVTGLGEAIGLGKIGQANLLTDVLSAPTAVLSGDTSTLHPAADATSIVATAENLATGTLSDAGVNPSIAAPAAATLADAQALQPTALEYGLNAPILAVHSTLESAADMDGTSGTVHGITNLGETVGLGKLGGDNLLTDVVSTPDTLLNGDTSSIANLPTDLSAIGTAGMHLVHGADKDLASGAALQDPLGVVTDVAHSLTTFPVASAVDGLVTGVEGTVEGATSATAPNTIAAVVGLGDAVGLGQPGANTLTDVLSAPGALASGDVTPIAALPGDLGHDLGSVSQAAPNVLDAVASDLSGSVLDTLTHPVTGGGLLAGDLPGQGIVDGIVTPVATAVAGTGSSLGLAPVTSAAADLAGTLDHTVTDVLHVPGDAIAGLSQGLAPLPSDVQANLLSLGSIVGSAVGETAHLPDIAGGAGALTPVTGLVSGLAGGSSPLSGLDGALSHGDLTGALAPVSAAVGSGSNVLAPVANLLGGSGTEAGSHDLATVAVGPAGAPNVGTVDLLGTSGGQSHVADVHAASVPASVPALANVGLLTGDSITFPSLGGHGTDALTGALTGTGASATAPAGAAVEHAGLDLGLAHVDLPIVHSDPLAALGHEAHHA